MEKKFRITVECIVDGKAETFIQEEYLEEDIQISQRRFLEPRYGTIVGVVGAVGFWDKGDSLTISAIRLKVPEAV